MIDPSIYTRLHEATLILLEKTGVQIDSPEALDLLQAHGVRTDRERCRVFPDESQVQTALNTAPRSIPLYGRRADRPLQIGGDNSYTLTGGASLRVLTLEGEYQPASWEHLRQFNRLLDALPHVHVCINQVDPLDQPVDELYKHLAAEMLIGISKPVCFQAFHPYDVEAMMEMGAALRGSSRELAEKPVFMIGTNSEPPLRIPRDMINLLMTAWRYGIPGSLGCYNMLGITSPVTAAGAVVQINAIQLATVLLSQLVKPGVGVFYTSFSGGGDLRTLELMTADPLTVQQNRLATGLGRWYGLPVYGLACTDARAADAQAAAEHAVQFLLQVEAGCNLLQGPTSMMDQVMLSSFAQAVIDNEIFGYLLACRAQPQVDAETLALEAIDQVTSDPEFHDLKFVLHPHTIRHLRDLSWKPNVFKSTSFQAWQQAGCPTVLGDAEKIARQLIATHLPPALDPQVEKEIRLIAEAGRHIPRRTAA